MNVRKIIVGTYGGRTALPSIPTIPPIKSKKIRQYEIGKIRRKTLPLRFSLKTRSRVVTAGTTTTPAY
jgi:hypothetical protein